MHDDGAIDRSEPARSARTRYWRSSVTWTLAGVLGWLVVTFAATWFAGAFNRWTVAGAPAGYWLAAQGAIGAYMLIIVAYAGIMDGLDERCQSAAGEPLEAVPTLAAGSATLSDRDHV